jgi:L-cystine transport system substrate-binding protein
MKSNLILAVLLSAVLFFPGCGAKKTSPSESAGPKVITVGVPIGSPLFFYLDDNGNFSGLESEILKLVDQKLPEYTFKYEILELKTILTSLDIGSIDFGSMLFEYNEERAKTYLFGKEGYLDFTTYITVPKGTLGINSLDDLQGKKVGAWPSSNMAYILESYNEQHPDAVPIDIIYMSSGDVLLTGFSTKAIDASLMTRYEALTYRAERGLELDFTGEPVSTSECYYLFPKNRTEIQSAVDKALRELKESGELEQTIQRVLDEYVKTYS